MDVAAWLRSLGMERYEQAFRENAIDGDVLCKLCADDLKELGVTSVGHRRKLLDALAALRRGIVPTPSAVNLSDAQGERRQVAVLFADLCDFTDMSRNIDAEEVLAVLERYFEQVDRIIGQHGGHVDKHVGDSVMALFGAPVAHGNDVERAVRAARAISDAMPGLSRVLARPVFVHIGIASGEVVASGTGSAMHREYTVTGETVNLASRLTDAAGRGEILVSDAVRRALANRLDCVERGAVSVKGFADPVSAWRVAGLRRSTFARPMVGRTDQLRAFRTVLRACRATGGGRTVLIRGEAGIGKTRLLEEFEREARDSGFACHGGFVLDFGAATGQGAIQSLVRGLLAPGDSNDGDTRVADLDRAFNDGLIDAGDALFLDDLIDLPMTFEDRAVYEAMDNTMRIRGRQNVVTRLVQRASRRQPRLLSVEDIHWSDGSTLRDLEVLSTTAGACPAVLVMTARPSGEALDDSWHAADGAPYSLVDLGPLSAGEARIMAESFPNAQADLAERCVARAAGNPLFLEQLLDSAETGAETGVPGSVRSLVQARLDRLDSAEKAMLKAASVLGQIFEEEAVDYLVDGTGAGAALEPLVAGRLLRRQGAGFIFHHALIRDAIYDGLLKSRCRALHRRAAQWYGERDRDPVLRAEHLDRAADREAALAYCDAARSQASAYRYESALQLIGRGLELAQAHGERVALECLRGTILHDTGDMTSALAAFESALRFATTEAERCRAWIGRATVKRVLDDLDGAWADLDRAATAAAAEGLQREEARIHFLRGNLCFPRGEIDGCAREHGLSLALAQASGDSEQEAAALGGLGDAEYMRGRMISAHDAFSRCIELCRRNGFGRIEVANLPMRAVTAWFAGDARTGLDIALASVAAAEKAGNLRALAVAHHAAWHCLHCLAQWDRAWEHVAPALQCARELKSKRFEGEALALRAESNRVAGRRREALDDIGEALSISRDTGMTYLGAAYLGVLAPAADDISVFESALAEGEAVLAAGAVSHNHFLFRRDAIDACIDRNRWDAAAHHAAALEAYARREPSPFSAFHVARAHALVAYGSGNRDAASTSELRRLQQEGTRAGFLHALEAIEGALSSQSNHH